MQRFVNQFLFSYNLYRENLVTIHEYMLQNPFENSNTWIHAPKSLQNLCGFMPNPGLCLSNARSTPCSVLLYSNKNLHSRFPFFFPSFLLAIVLSCKTKDYSAVAVRITTGIWVIKRFSLSAVSVPGQFHNDSTGFQTLLKEKEKLSNNYGQSSLTKYCFITWLKLSRITVESPVWSTPEHFSGSSVATV